MILVASDDGVYSPGIQLLAKRLKALDSVIIVTPERKLSAVGRSRMHYHPRSIDLTKAVACRCTI